MSSVVLAFGLSGNEDSFTVSVPRRRWDITIEADLFEEIARIYGYDRLPTSLPKDDGTAGELTATQKLRRQVRTIAEGAGLTEIITYALTTPEKKQLSSQLNQVTRTYVANDSGSLRSPPKYGLRYP